MTIPNPLSEKTTAEIEALSRKISVAQELDGEIQTELRGHIEDKVRGYVSGAVKVSEADAMLLAKAHFGDAAVIKAMFQGVHNTAHSVSLARRLAAVFALSAVITTNMRVVSVLWLAAVIYPATIIEGDQHAGISQFSSLFFGIFSIVAWTAMVWWTLAGWRKRMDFGKTLWFEKWKPITLVYMMLAVVIGMVVWSVLITSGYSLLFSSSITVRAFYRGASSGWAAAAHGTLNYVGYAIDALLWLWWCDRAPRTRRSLIYSAVAWVIAQQLIVFGPLVVSTFVHDAIAIISEKNLALSVRLYDIWHGWLYNFGHIRPLIQMNFLIDLGIIVVASIAYFLVTRSRRTAAISNA